MEEKSFENYFESLVNSVGRMKGNKHLEIEGESKCGESCGSHRFRVICGTLTVQMSRLG